LFATASQKPNSKNEENQTILEQAIIFGYHDVAYTAIAHGAQFKQNTHGKYPLFLASQKDSFNIFKLLINKGANVNNKNTDKRLTALHFIVSSIGKQPKYEAFFNLLINSEQVDPSVTNSSGETISDLIKQLNKDNDSSLKSKKKTFERISYNWKQYKSK
jgi:ankyrin repeat protein